MAEAIQFQDGERYESMMGVWSALAGAPFLDWLNMPAGARWVDVGCGNGASTELIIEKAKPASVAGIDPSEAQLAYARTRHRAGLANFTLGSALELPYADGAFDVAMMALVIFFVPDPARGVAEMRRVVRSGGKVAAYAWDLEGGGFPYEAVQVALRSAGIEPLQPPHPEAAALRALFGMWTDAGLVDVETREITVQRAFPSFGAYWSTATSSPAIAQVLSRLDPEQVDLIHDRAQASLGSGELVVQGRAHAVRGRVPG